MEGSALLNFRAFQRLCGEDNFEHIFLCTTFWDIVDEAKGAAREKELCENPDFWAKMMNQGSRVVRVKNYAQSEEILLQMAQKSTVTLNIQKEMVEERRSLDDTAVGKTVNAQLAQLKAEHEAQLVKAKRDAEIALKIRDEENQKRAQEQLRRHESVKEAQEKLLREQEMEGERLRARLEAMEREAESHRHKERKRLEEIKAENKRLEAEREHLKNESAKRQADEHRRLSEQKKKFLGKQYCTQFESQSQTLDRARQHRMVSAKLYGFNQQTPAFLRWCDRCFTLIGFRAFYRKWS